MLYVRLRECVFQLPTAVDCLPQNSSEEGNFAEFCDRDRTVVARFHRPDVLAFSSQPEKLERDLVAREAGGGDSPAER